MGHCLRYHALVIQAKSNSHTCEDHHHCGWQMYSKVLAQDRSRISFKYSAPYLQHLVWLCDLLIILLLLIPNSTQPRTYHGHHSVPSSPSSLSSYHQHQLSSTILPPPPRTPHSPFAQTRATASPGASNQKNPVPPLRVACLPCDAVGAVLLILSSYFSQSGSPSWVLVCWSLLHARSQFAFLTSRVICAMHVMDASCR